MNSLANPFRPLLGFRYSTRPSYRAMHLLTLSEMADELGLSTKTFSADVKTKGIPFISAGKRQRFDPIAVKAYLTSTHTEPVSNVRHFPVGKRKKIVISKKFAEAV